MRLKGLSCIINIKKNTKKSFNHLYRMTCDSVLHHKVHLNTFQDK